MTDAQVAQEPRQGLRGKKRVLAIVGAIFVVLFLIVELGLRFIPVPGFTQRELNPNFMELVEKARTRGHPYLGYSLTPDWHSRPEDPNGQKSHNAHGLRGAFVPTEKPAGTYRIICLGGSSTYGNTPTADEKTWPARLQFWLNDKSTKHGMKVEVINAGAPGYSTTESYINLNLRMLEFEPDLVVVYHSINDMRCALWPNPVSDNSHWREIWPHLKQPPGERLLEKSMTYLIWRKYMTDYVESIDDLGTYAIVGYDPDDPDPFAKDAVPDRGFDNFRRNLISIQAVAKAHGADVMLATQGLDGDDIKAKGSRQNQLDGMDRMTRILKEVAAEYDLYLADVEKALEDLAAEKGAGHVFTGEVHLNDRGADRVALTLAAQILANDLIR